MDEATLRYNLYMAYDQWSKGEISGKQFKGKVIHYATLCSMTAVCGSVGATIGSVVIPIPGVGGFIGGTVGMMAGADMGSKLGGFVVQSLPCTQP